MVNYVLKRSILLKGDTHLNSSSIATKSTIRILSAYLTTYYVY